MKYLTLLVVFLATLAVLGCSQQAADQAKLREIEAKENLPLWSGGDFDYRGTALVYNVVINQKPPYYRGKMPLNFKQSQLPIPNTAIVLDYEFNDYVVMFTRNGPIYKGACAIDKSGTKLLAEVYRWHDSRWELNILSQADDVEWTHVCYFLIVREH